VALFAGFYFYPFIRFGITLTCDRRTGEQTQGHSICRASIASRGKKMNTLRIVEFNKVRLRSEHDLLQDDSEAVDVSFLSPVDRSSCRTQ